MVKKGLFLMIALIMVLTSSVFAVNTVDESEADIHTYDCCELDSFHPDDEIQAASFNILCTLFGHTDFYYKSSTVNTMCVRVGDSYCEVKCSVNKYCGRCNENTAYTYMHAISKCLRDDTGYSCSSDHSF